MAFLSAEHEYLTKGTHRNMVKAVDILGVDTSHIIEVNLKPQNPNPITPSPCNASAIITC